MSRRLHPAHNYRTNKDRAQTTILMQRGSYWPVVACCTSAATGLAMHGDGLERVTHQHGGAGIELAVITLRQ